MAPIRGYTKYGPHEIQRGLVPYYQQVARARKEAPRKLTITDVLAFPVQKHGMRPKEAIAFSMVVGGQTINQQAGVMGGISAGIAEPGTHPSIEEAINFFEKHVRANIRGLNVGRPDDITNALISLDSTFRHESNKPLFSHVGSELDNQ